MRTLATGLLLMAGFVDFPASAQVDFTVNPDHTVRVTHSSVVGQQYFLEKSADLMIWERSGPILPGLGAPLSWDEVPPAGDKYFYQVSSGPRVTHRLFGINFSPYLDGQSPNKNSVISRRQILDRMRPLVHYGDWVRTFGIDGGLEDAGEIAHQLGLQVAVGAWLAPEVWSGTGPKPAVVAANEAKNAATIGKLIQLAQDGEVDICVVGNEMLLKNSMSPSRLIHYINQVRSAVPGSVRVTTADDDDELLADENAAVVPACDVVFANLYGFWDSLTLQAALPRLHARYHDLKRLAGQSKEVWISETGWPSQGNARGLAIPSLSNAKTYFHQATSWARRHHVNLFYFSAYDEAWKAADGDYSAWGIQDSKGVMKTGLADILSTQFLPADWNATLQGSGTPTITFTTVPPRSQTKATVVAGTVSHIAPFDHVLVLYINVNGTWWIKPTARKPHIEIVNGAWSATFVSHGNDVLATEFMAFLFAVDDMPFLETSFNSVPASYNIRVAQTTVIRP